MRFSSRRDGVSIDPAFPDTPSDAFELADTERPPLITGLGARRGQRRDDGGTVGLIDFRRVKVLVQQHHQHGIEFLIDIDGAEPLPWLSVRQEATTLDLEAAA